MAKYMNNSTSGRVEKTSLKIKYTCSEQKEIY